MREVALVSRERPGGSGRGGSPDRTPRYWAFLSYSHKDTEIADWLHGALERYRVPRALVGRETATGTIPPSFSPIFRDRHELAASGDLGHNIREALGASRCLIVLCSPEAAQSRWTNEEILAFRKLHPQGRLLAAITGGEPFASDIPGREAEECFPPALRQKFDSRGRPTGKRAEPIAADLRADKDGRQLGLLKIVAGMIGVGLDDLVQREQQRRQKRLTFIAGASLAGMTVTSGLAVFAFDKRDEARDQRREAEGLVGFMLGDLRQKLEPIGRLDALDAVGSRALQYYQQQDKAELSDEALTQRSKALTLMGEIAQRRGDLGRALALYREAWAGTAESLRREPDNGQRIFDHAQNVFWIGAIAVQRGSNRAAKSAFREYKRLAEQLVALDPSRKEWRLEAISADTNLGIVLLQDLHYQESARIFARALQNVETLAASEPQNRVYQDQLTETLAWLAQSRESAGTLDEALAARERQLALLERIAARSGADTNVKRRIMVAHRVIGRLFSLRGEVSQGLDHLQSAIDLANQLIQMEPDSSEWAEMTAGSYLDLGELQLGIGSADAAAASARMGCTITNRLLEKDSTVAAWRVVLRSDCLGLRTRLALAAGANDEGRAIASQAIALAQTESLKNKSLEAQFSLASAHFHQGQAAVAMRDRAGALRSYRAALDATPRDVELKPRQLARYMLALRAVGRKDEAAALGSRLDAMGYRHPGLALERRLTAR